MIGTKEKIMKALIDSPSGMYELKPYKAKRGLQANNYFHRLVGILARGETVPFDRKKNELIRNYGNRVLLRDTNGKALYRILPDTDSWMDDPINHFVPTSYTDEFMGTKTRAFCILQGTRDYNSLDMYYLIQGARAECEGSGVPREIYETPEELALWEKLRGYEKKHHAV